MDFEALPPSAPERGAGCEGCQSGNRRDFLRQAAGAMAAALLGLGMSPAHAQAFPVEAGTPLGLAGDELTLAIPTRDGATIYKEHGVILARTAGAAFAFSLACPHQRAAIRWLGDQGRFQCSKHKSKYRPDGVFISGRATRSMDRFALRRQGADLVVNLSKLLREDRDPAAWKAAAVWLDEK